MIAAVGRLKDGPERELFQRYWTRTEGLGKKLALSPLSLVEFPESRAGSAASRRDEEAAKLAGAAAGLRVFALDEGGRQMSSETFATELRKHRDAGAAGLVFLIGGPDGHGTAVRQILDDKSSLGQLSLGAMTLPHGLARVVLAEQLYRAATIIAGHPYHRS
jgi:23S rRNA (pseudouridine1915-N3)-methyltransferase